MFYYSSQNLMANCYLIRLRKDPDMYLHPDQVLPAPEKDQAYLEMVFKKGYKGAVAFPEEQVEKILNTLKSDDLEKIKASDLIGNDGSLN